MTEPPFLKDPTGRRHLLNEEVTRIGRAVENDIVITSKRVSREHVHIRRDEWRLIVEDRNSANGTYLNGERLLSPTQLRDGDRIQVGDVLFAFHDPDLTQQDSLFPELEHDPAGQVVRVNRQNIDLAPKEYALFVYLYERVGEVCAKDEIGTAVWPEYQDGVYDYQIENLVRRLRAKIEPDPADPQLLLTVRGRGYKLIS